jgi:hypothetical protein
MLARLGRRSAAPLVRHAFAPLSRPTAVAALPSRFCAAFGLDPEAKPPSKRPTRGKKSGPSKGLLGLGAAGLVGIGYAASEDFRQAVDSIKDDVGEAAEDFNDSTREFFERIGDYFVAQRQEPWLLDLATMKYPDNIPTLVLDLDKVVLHLEHDSRNGWHVIKRPFADRFFKEIIHYYEVVIFSDDVFPVALDIINKMEVPVTGVLHRDFCKKKRNHYIKDISKLGRKMDRILLLDHDEQAFRLQPENGVLIRPFNGDPNDCELYDLLEFLKAAALSQTDLRQYVKKFGGGDCDIGKRYLLHKQDQDSKVESRRSLGRVFTASQRPGFPSSPSQGLGTISR